MLGTELDTSQIGKRLTRTPNPAIKMARTRLKQRLSKRSLGPLAGG
jgi:hypothetical protein